MSAKLRLESGHFEKHHTFTLVEAQPNKHVAKTTGSAFASFLFAPGSAHWASAHGEIGLTRFKHESHLTLAIEFYRDWRLKQ